PRADEAAARGDAYRRSGGRRGARRRRLRARARDAARPAPERGRRGDTRRDPRADGADLPGAGAGASIGVFVPKTPSHGALLDKSAARRPPICHGTMFWFSRNRLTGSYLRFTVRSRSSRAPKLSATSAWPPSG